MPFYCPDTLTYWPRCVAFIDMVAFFPSCEQLDFPQLKDKPVAVINGSSGQTIISSSYECRALGIKTGFKINEAKKLCPDIIIRVTRPQRYTQISTNIMSQLKTITPDIEVYSIDECFMDLAPVLKLYQSIQVIADKIRKTVFNASGGLNCSIGISEGMLTAKWAASQNKGKTIIISPIDIQQQIGQAPIQQICGIGKNMQRYLNNRQIYYCKDMKNYPMSILSQRFGDLGRRLYLTCLGHDPYPISTKISTPKSMGHGKILPPATIDKKLIYGVLRRLVERLSSRLRKNQLASRTFLISYKQSDGWVKGKYQSLKLINQTQEIWFLVKKHFEKCHQPLFQVQITAIYLENIEIKQLDLFNDAVDSYIPNQIDDIKDKINQKFGKHSIKSGTELFVSEDTVKPVIAFRWSGDIQRDTL